MREQDNKERRQEVNRTIAQVLLTIGALLSLFGGMFMAAYSALPVIPVIYIITGVQVAGLFTMVWKLGGQTEQETIFLYLLIGIGIFLLMFGICVGIGSYTTIN